MGDTTYRNVVEGETGSFRCRCVSFNVSPRHRVRSPKSQPYTVHNYG